MPWQRRVVLGLRALLRRQEADEALDAELSHFLDTAIDQKIASGMSASDAARAARLELGSVAAVKDRVRDVGWESFADGVGQDVRYAIRGLRRWPGFTAVILVTLALGIGANTAVFSLINALILRPLPVRNPEQLVELLSAPPGDPRMNYFAWRFYEHYRDGSRTLSDLTAVSRARFQLSSDGRDAEDLDGEYVVGTLFPALGLQPGIGRLIGPDDDRLGAGDPAVAVVSWSYWQSRFNLDPAILGTTITINGVPATIVGVTPRAFTGLQVGFRTDLWVPVAMEPLLAQPSHRVDGSLGMQVLGRLKPGTSIEQARAEMTILDRLRTETIANTSNDSRWRQVTIDLQPAGAGFSTLRDQWANQLLVLMTVVGLLLLIACASIASLLLSRAVSRQREIAVRVALGAGRLRLIRQMLLESLCLSGIGSLFGILVGWFGADALVQIMSSGRPMPGWPDHLEVTVQPDLQVLGFTAGIAALTGIVFGLAPAWSAFASAPAGSLREIGGPAVPPSRRVFGKGLVAMQVALSVVLLSAAGLFVRQLSTLRSADLGFHRDSVLLVALNPQGSGYNRSQLTSMYRELLGRLETIPGVRSASLSMITPINGAGAARFARVAGFQERGDERQYLALNLVGPQYFKTLGTPLIAGRDFAFGDTGGQLVAIVNQAMAQHYFRDRSALGQHLTFDGDERPYEIVGVSGDAKYADLHNPAPRTVYLDTFQDGAISNQLAIRTIGRPTAVAGEVRRTVADAVKGVRVSNVTTLADQIDASLIPERLIAALAGSLGGLGALLAAIGLYGLLAFTVARRTSEIGLRMALGATRRDLMMMVLKTALGLVAAGLAIGVPIAIVARRLVGSLIHDLRVGPAWPIVFAAGAMMAIALVAAYMPARRALRVNPVDALRHG